MDMLAILVLDRDFGVQEKAPAIKTGNGYWEGQVLPKNRIRGGLKRRDIWMAMPDESV